MIEKQFRSTDEGSDNSLRLLSADQNRVFLELYFVQMCPGFQLRHIHD